MNNLLGWSQVYNVELWTSEGSLIADISQVVQQKGYILTRNDAEQFTFQIDLTTFEKYCASINVNPNDLIAPYKTDVKLKRNGVYLFVVQVVGLEFECDPTDSGVNPETGSYSNQTSITETVTVTCTGYLNIFLDRYIDTTYINADPAWIAGNLITLSQTLLSNGNVGINVPSSLNYLTGQQITTTLTQQQVKEELQTLAEVSATAFDFAIDANKNFNTYQYIGNQRNDITLTYGGPGSNVTGLYHERTSAGALYNEIIGEGYGNGDAQLTVTEDNIESQLLYFLRQNIIEYSNVSDQPTLDMYASADLSRMSTLIDIPQITTNGSIFQNNTIPFFSVGDRLPLSFPTHKFLENLDGQYFRIEAISVNVDDNDYDYEINLTLDNYNLNISV